jgi:ABC-type antimicrobial peptide transport system permease subunit
VAGRTREIGIRVALGAAPRRVATSIFARGLALAVIGVAAGLAAALVFTRFLGSVLYGVRPADPFTFLAVTATLLLAAALACAIPALRATRVEPCLAIRQD